MSHVASIDIEIKDLAALKAACAEVGLQFKEGQTTYKWYGRWMNDYSGADAAFKADVSPKDYGKCAHAIGVPGNSQAYEIGVVQAKDGKYKLVWDFWQGGFGLEKLAGPKCSHLVQSYVGHVAKKTLAQQGYAFTGTKKLKDGTVEMVFTHA